jgi:hypothetical protein
VVSVPRPKEIVGAMPVRVEWVSDHQVQAHGAGVAQLIIQVGGGAGVIAVASRDIENSGIAQMGRLGSGIDGAAAGAATEHQPGRAFQDLHLFIIETVAGIGREVAQAIQIDIVLGVEAVDLELVARQRAAFADRDGDARDILQGIAQGGDGLLFHGLAGDHADRLGRVLDRNARHGRDRRGVIEAVIVGIVLDRDRPQLDRRSLRRDGGGGQQATQDGERCARQDARLENMGMGIV